jgi:hypothetical protein
MLRLPRNDDETVTDEPLVRRTLNFPIMRQYWAAIDLVIVLLFVGIGRNTHDHGISVSGVASTMWPFAIGLVVGWMVVGLRRRSGRSIRDGITIVVATVALGMILRVMSGQGTAFAFILVATGFLGLTMLGWRAIANFRKGSND